LKKYARLIVAKRPQIGVRDEFTVRAIRVIAGLSENGALASVILNF